MLKVMGSNPGYLLFYLNKGATGSGNLIYLKSYCLYSSCKKPKKYQVPFFKVFKRRHCISDFEGCQLILPAQQPPSRGRTVHGGPFFLPKVSFQKIKACLIALAFWFCKFLSGFGCFHIMEFSLKKTFGNSVKTIDDA